MALWWASDFHFGHENIIRFSKRPYKNADEMDTAMISNFNSVVKPDDTAYILGDFAFYRDQSRTREVIRSLGGKEKHLVLGNHDCYLTGETLALFTSVQHYLEIVVPDPDAPRGKQLIVMLHYPLRRWNKSHFASWALFGHCHNHLPDDPNLLSIDVGVDCHNYTPISYDQVKVLMAKKTFVPIERDRQ